MTSPTWRPQEGNAPWLLHEHPGPRPYVADTYRWRPPRRLLVRRVHYPSLHEAQQEMLAEYDAAGCKPISFGGADRHEWWLWQCPPTADTPWPERYIVRFRPAPPTDDCTDPGL